MLLECVSNNLEIDMLFNSFCILEMINQISKKQQAYKVATDNTVDKLSNRMIKISKKKNDFEAAILFRWY